MRRMRQRNMRNRMMMMRKTMKTMMNRRKIWLASVG
jgi:hypothetical protein